MEQLTTLETTLLNNLIEKYPALKAHLPYLKVKNRETTKVGMTVNFEYTDDVEKLNFDDFNALFSGGENIEIKGLKQGLSYVIDITDGQIEYIEFSTYGENWNGQFGDYKIISE
jgi:hypothetical protein